MLAVFKCLGTQHRLNRDKANKPMSFCFYSQVFVLLSQLLITPQCRLRAKCGGIVLNWILVN